MLVIGVAVLFVVLLASAAIGTRTNVPAFDPGLCPTLYNLQPRKKADAPHFC